MAICTACGVWTEPPVLVQASAGVEVSCPHCGHEEPFARYPLCWIGGSSGSGKSTLVPLLRLCLPGYVILRGGGDRLLALRWPAGGLLVAA